MIKRFTFSLFFGVVFICVTYGQNNPAAAGPVPDSVRVYTSLAEALRAPDSVYHLQLVKKKLTAFPYEILKLTNLRSLSLSGNKIRAIPADIAKLSLLEKLDLSRNRLVELPPEIGKLSRLKELILYQNDIDTIPKELGQLTELEVLDLWENELSSLPEELKDLRKLKVVDLRGILFTEKQQLYFKDLFPAETIIYLSPGCNSCKDP
jgi:Leucine-rich repeat (LRR) protein